MQHIQQMMALTKAEGENPADNISKDYEVGHGRPPKHSRWKKGQCGNPNRIHKRRPKKVVQLVDDFFARDIDIVENGISRRVSAFEAISIQLCIKATAGGKRAMSVLLEYQNFTASRGGRRGYEIMVVSDDYTQILRPYKPPETGDGHV